MSNWNPFHKEEEKVEDIKQEAEETVQETEQFTDEVIDDAKDVTEEIGNEGEAVFDSVESTFDDIEEEVSDTPEEFDLPDFEETETASDEFETSDEFATSEESTEEIEFPEDEYHAYYETPQTTGETALQNVAKGQLSFNEQVLEKIASLALQEVGGVLAATSGGGFFNLKSSKGVEIQIHESQEVIVNLEVILEYGKSAPEVYDELKRSITERVRVMTGLKVREVNVRVLNVLTAEEFNGKN